MSIIIFCLKIVILMDHFYFKDRIGVFIAFWIEGEL